MAQSRCEQPGILQVIPGRRIIQYCGDPYLTATVLRSYGEVILGHTETGPHILRVRPSLDFVAVVAAVKAQLTSDRSSEGTRGA